MLSPKDVGRLAKEDFLKLLMAQLKNQDPLKPVDDAQFITQLAQFTMLEYVQEMDERVGNLLDVERLGQGNQLIGKQVEGVTEAGESVQGIVQTAKVVDGKVVLQVGGVTLPLENVESVTESTESQLMRASGLIGRNVETRGNQYAEPIKGTVRSVSMVDGSAVLIVDGRAVKLNDVVRVDGGDLPLFAQATSMIGKEIFAESQAGGYSIVGLVDQVRMEGGEVLLSVEGRHIKLSDVVSVSKP